MLFLRGGLDEVMSPEQLVRWYDGGNVKFGPAYYRTVSQTPTDTVILEDLGYAVLFAGRPTPLAARSLAENPIDISEVPNDPLAQLGVDGIDRVVDAIMRLVQLPGFGSAVATKVLHKKRPASVPVLDNKAIFATYMDHGWRPGRDLWPRRSVPVKSRETIVSAVVAIAADVSDPRNANGWTELERKFSALTRIELFDKVWWSLAHSSKPTPDSTGPW